MSTYDNSPYRKRMIKDITSKDHNIQVIGRIAEQSNDNADEYVFNDDTGKISVVFKQDDPILNNLKVNMIIKVMGELVGDSKDLLSVKYSSDYSEIDWEAYKKTYELKKKYF